MFSNIMPCCKNCLNPNELLYVEVRNDCPYYIYVLLNYKVNGKTHRKQTPVFAPGKLGRLTFPSDASSVVFKALNCAQRPPGILYTKRVPNYVSSCYKITGPSLGHITCEEVPC